MPGTLRICPWECRGQRGGGEVQGVTTLRVNYGLGYKLQQCVCDIQVLHVHEGVGPRAVTRSGEATQGLQV